MITIVNDNNEKKYDNLFKEASAALKLSPNSRITDLETYFYYLPELIGLEDGKGYKYTVLPLDEEAFEIEPETRKIIIPKSFEKSVGVTGDHTAEILWFKIGRYFDNMDLDTQEIYI
jgi:hypothetical protein